MWPGCIAVEKLSAELSQILFEHANKFTLYRHASDLESPPDWDRVGALLKSALLKVTTCLTELDNIKTVAKRAGVKNILRDVVNVAKAVDRKKTRSNKFKKANQEKCKKYLGAWQKATVMARKELGITGMALIRKGTPLYTKTKEIHATLTAQQYSVGDAVQHGWQ